MVRSIRLRLMLVNVLVVIVAVVFTFLLARGTVSSEIRRSQEFADARRSEPLTRNLSASYIQHGGWSDAQRAVEQMNRFVGQRILVVDAGGKVVGDSDSTLLGRTIAVGRLPSSSRILVKGETVGYLLVGPLAGAAASENSLISTVTRLLLLSASVSGFIAIVVTLILSRRIVRPIIALTAAAQQMEKGDLSVRVDVDGSDEIGALANSFNAMASGLARLEELRRHMVNDAAHELRTPLTNLRGYLEAAREGLIEPDAHWIENLYEETMLLNRLADDLQDLALAEARQLSLMRQPVSIHDLVQTALDAVRPQADRRGLNLRLAVPPDLPLIDADPARVGQVLRNLLNNALDFTPTGGDVTVTARADKQWVRVEVHDTGRGIAPEHLPFVFERFYRVDTSRARATGGSGLGLTIVKNLVEAHGGQVWADSTPGVGSTFGFSLPIVAASQT